MELIAPLHHAHLQELVDTAASLMSLQGAQGLDLPRQEALMDRIAEAVCSFCLGSAKEPGLLSGECRL